MTVQVKLGRWRTRDGSVAEVTTDKSSMPGYPWGGTYAGSGLTWNARGKQDIDDSDADLIEYLGPLETDLATFIAGLKPGDYYADKRGKKQHFIGHHPNGGIVIVDGSHSQTVANDYSKYPAGPWVEPPKVHRMILVWPKVGSPVLHDIGDLREYRPSAIDEVVQRLTYTEGSDRFELGEVIK